MRRLRMPFHRVAVIAGFVICCATGCESIAPDKFATIEEAYHTPDSYAITRDVPSDSYKRTLFEAPYRDVFRAVSVGATQAQLNIESSDKAGGLILASRDVMRPFQRKGTSASKLGGLRKYFYAIVVKEKGPSSTELVVLSKVQISCGYFNAPSTLFVSLGTGCCLLFPILEDNSFCSEKSKLHWASGDDTSIEEIGQVINFTRNNLIAAGAL